MWVAVVLALGVAIPIISLAQEVQLAPRAELPQRAELRPGGLVSGAQHLHMAAVLLPPRARCSDTVARSAQVTLEWTPHPLAGAIAQRIQLTKFRRGFERGDFEESQELGLGVSQLAIHSPEPGIVYRWRVAVGLQGGGVALSDVSRFEVPICPGDGAAVE